MFNDQEDRARMARIARGDTRAFEELYRGYEKALGHFLFRMCYDRTMAEDGLQEVFLRVWKAAPRWRGEGKVSTFLFQIAKNAALDARHKWERERARLGPAAPGERASQGWTEAVDTRPGPSSALEGEELRAAVRRAVESLPEAQRVVIHLAQTEGLTYREIARILQWPLGTVKSRMAAAVESLRWKLTRHAGE